MKLFSPAVIQDSKIKYGVIRSFRIHVSFFSFLNKIYFGIILLYAHVKKHVFFFFLINVFWGVDSKSAIHFFRPALENPHNPEKTFFPDYRGFLVSDYKNGLQHLFRSFGRSKNLIDTSDYWKITANLKKTQ